MSRCLSERELFLLFDGAPNRAEQDHLGQCNSCAARYRQLQRDLKTIGQTLRDTAPPQSIRDNMRPWSFRWLPAAVGLALLLVTAWHGGRLWNRSGANPLQGFSREEIWGLMQDLSADLSLISEAKAEEIWSEVGELDEVLVAPDEDSALARGEVEELEFLADLPCPLCLERSQNAKPSPPKSNVPKNSPQYKMEVF